MGNFSGGPWGSKRTKYVDEELKQRIVELRGRGMNNTQVARELDVPRTTVSYHARRLRRYIKKQKKDTWAMW